MLQIALAPSPVARREIEPRRRAFLVAAAKGWRHMYRPASAPQPDNCLAALLVLGSIAEPHGHSHNTKKRQKPNHEQNSGKGKNKSFGNKPRSGRSETSPAHNRRTSHSGSVERSSPERSASAFPAMATY